MKTDYFMNKTIWFISKYCTPEKKKIAGSRGWYLIKEFSNKGYQTVLISSVLKNTNNKINPKFKFKNYKKDGVKIILLKTLNYSIRKSMKRIFSWLDFELKLFFLDKSILPKPNVIIISSLSILTILNGIFLKNKFNCKLVFEIRDIWPLTLVEEGNFSKKNPFIIFLKYLEKFGYKKADFIVGTMPHLKLHVNNILGYNKSVNCIPMGVSDNLLKNKEDISSEYIQKYLNPNFFNILYVGSIGITNALDTLFKTAEILSGNLKIKFVIVGDGYLKDYYIKKYKHLSNLIFAPKVHKNKVQSVLSYANVLYFGTYKSKVWKYGQSLNKLIDYMISAKPIIASYSGYQSMINEANCGFFIPAEDPNLLAKTIIKITKIKKSKLNIIGKKGRNWLLQNRKYNKLADDYLKILF